MVPDLVRQRINRERSPGRDSFGWEFTEFARRAYRKEALATPG